LDNGASFFKLGGDEFVVVTGDDDVKDEDVNGVIISIISS
jgi:hypothetical protein